jgi:pimeloyl-ACP methyl ester carboxylesterase
MTDYVLIHGAWHGSWCWNRVRRLLASQAHQVFTPTLTGIGERSHLLSRDVDLDTHVADVANLMTWEDLRDIVLVGHSYGGVVARHVADRMPDRIRSLVYLDAFVPDNGKAVFDYVPDSGKSLRELAVANGDGWKIPPPPARSFAVNAADADWVDRQCTMHPLSTLEVPAQISGACDDIPAIGYILAGGFEGPFGQFYAQAGERRWWQAELACGHDVMLDMPNELTALLLRQAQESS